MNDVYSKYLRRNPLTRPPPQLYEGNYEEWLRELEATLNVKGHRTAAPLASTATLPPSDAVPITRAECFAVGTEILTPVKHHIRTELLARVPKESQSDLHDLLPALRAVATPFQLLDLPPELRVRIYEIALRRPTPLKLFCAAPRQRAQYHSSAEEREAFQPPLVRVSRPLREETLPIFFANTAFTLPSKYQRTLDSDDLPVVDIGRWARQNGTMFAYHRRLTVAAMPSNVLWMHAPDGETWRSRVKELTVRYVLGVGLEIGFEGSFLREEYRQFVAHAAAAERYRKARGLHGEAVALFFCAATDNRQGAGVEGSESFEAASSDLEL